MTIEKRQIYIALGSLVAAILVFWAGYTKGLKDAPCGPSLTGSVAVSENLRSGYRGLQKRAEIIKQLEEENDAQSSAMASALAAYPGWSDEPLPPDVAERLRKRP